MQVQCILPGFKKTATVLLHYSSAQCELFCFTSCDHRQDYG